METAIGFEVVRNKRNSLFVVISGAGGQTYHHDNGHSEYARVEHLV